MVGKVLQCLQSFRHKTGIGQMDGQNNWYNNIALCVLTHHKNAAALFILAHLIVIGLSGK